MAAASAGSVNRISSVRRSAPWVWAMSRRTPPAPIAASCWSSPMRRTDPPRASDELDDGVEGEGVGHAGLVDHDEGGRRRCRAAQSGRSPWAMDQVSLARVSVTADAGPWLAWVPTSRSAAAWRVGCGGADLVAEDRGCGRGRGEPDDVAAAVGPGGGQRPQGGRLPRSGGCDRQLQPRPGGRHPAHQRGLSGVEGDPVRGRLEQRQLDIAACRRWPRRSRPAASRRRCSAARTAAEVYWSAPCTV